jgi:hypothetical protein
LIYMKKALVWQTLKSEFIYLFHPFDTNVYRTHPSILILSFYNSNYLVQCIYGIKIYIASVIHIQFSLWVSWKNFSYLRDISRNWHKQQSCKLHLIRFNLNKINVVSLQYENLGRVLCTVYWFIIHSCD